MIIFEYQIIIKVLYKSIYQCFKYLYIIVINSNIISEVAKFFCEK